MDSDGLVKQFAEFNEGTDNEAAKEVYNIFAEAEKARLLTKAEATAAQMGVLANWEAARIFDEKSFDEMNRCLGEYKRIGPQELYHVKFKAVFERLYNKPITGMIILLSDTIFAAVPTMPIDSKNESNMTFNLDDWYASPDWIWVDSSVYQIKPNSIKRQWTKTFAEAFVTATQNPVTEIVNPNVVGWTEPRTDLPPTGQGTPKIPHWRRGHFRKYRSGKILSIPECRVGRGEIKSHKKDEWEE